MGDLDSLFQDFSYLKSLEHKNSVPKKAAKKLLLPDQSCKYAVEWRFKKKHEAEFHRIFHRPLGHRCFRDFLLDTKNENPVGFMLLEFIREVEDLTALRADDAFKTAMRIKKTYLDSQAIRNAAQTIWMKASLVQRFNDHMDRLKRRVGQQQESKTSNQHVVNVKEVFMPFTKDAKDFLSDDPWDAFRESKFWTRYLQWKQLELNTSVNEQDFDVHRILGRGGFGEVFGCRKFDTGALFAMKKLDKRRLKLKSQENTAVHERKVLSEMSSKFVTNLKYAFHDKDTLYLLLDLCEGGDLSWHLHKLKRFTEEQAKFYTAEIIMGLAHIHDKKMIYRDLKPANVLLDGAGHARISDLGLVRDIKNNKPWPTSECGTQGYMAPEVLEKDKKYGPASDWFSLGCTIFQFFTGHTPFRLPKGTGKRETKEEVTKKTKFGEVEMPPHIPPLAQDLIMKLLEVDPDKRLGSRAPPDGAKDVRAHPWFDDIDWQALMDHKLKPQIIPTRGMVNAQDVHDIDRFDFSETRRIKITDEDHEKYKHFNHIMSHNWQEEVLVMYDLITQECDTREKKDEQRRSKLAASGKAYIEQGEKPIMQGLWLKESRRFHFWNKRYVRLYHDRLCWGDDEALPPKNVHLLTDIRYTTEEYEADKFARRPDNIMVITILNKGKEVNKVVFKCLYSSDFPMWSELLQGALEAVGPSSNPRRLTEALTPLSGGPKERPSELEFGDKLSEDEQGKTMLRLQSDPATSSGPTSPSPSSPQRSPNTSPGPSSVASSKLHSSSSSSSHVVMDSENL